MEDNLKKKIEVGLKKIKNGRQPQKKMEDNLQKKMEDDLQKNDGRQDIKIVCVLKSQR